MANDNAPQLGYGGEQRAIDLTQYVTNIKIGGGRGPDVDAPISYTLAEAFAHTPESVPDGFVARALQALDDVDAYRQDMPLEQAVRIMLAAVLPTHFYPCTCIAGHDVECPAADRD